MKLSSTNSRMANEPSVHVPRTRFKVPIHTHKLTFNNGDLIPIKVMEILPGDTVSLDVASVIRMNTPVKPVMDNVWFDQYWFFIPRRLVWSHWEEFMGSNKSGPWTSSVSYNVPHTKAPSVSLTYYNLSGGNGYWFKPVIFVPDPVSGVLVGDQKAYFESLRDRGVLAKKYNSTSAVVIDDFTEVWSSSTTYYILFIGWDVGSIASYMGMPIGTYCEIDSCYLRSYCLVWNEFFRDQNYMNYANFDFNVDSDRAGTSRWYGIQSKDYVTQPVLGGRPLQVSRFHDYFSSVLPEPQFGDPVQIPFSSSAPVFDDVTNLFQPKMYNANGGIVASHPLYSNSDGLSTDLNTTLAGTSSIRMGLSADVQSVAGTIMDLRNAFQIQKYLERSARYGSRYIEIILGQFGVINPDYRLQRPELLCSFRKCINMAQVLQTSSTDSVSPQGNTSAYSLTTDKRSCFTKSFTEHGILLGLVCCRTSRSYQQGVNKQFSRRRKLDFYFPVFAHISEQPVLNKEIFCHFNKNVFSGADPDLYKYQNEVFGYQEAWAEYKYSQSMISGEFASQSPTPLDFWHYADYYDTEVYASDEWLFEGPQNLDRTLAVSSSICDQFYADVAFDMTIVRPMPLFSIPGLADHF